MDETEIRAQVAKEQRRWLFNTVAALGTAVTVLGVGWKAVDAAYFSVRQSQAVIETKLKSIDDKVSDLPTIKEELVRVKTTVELLQERVDRLEQREREGRK